MANELRVRANLLPTLVLTSAYDPSTDTTIAAAELASWPVIDATNHMAVTVDWDRGTGTPFILYITAHTSAATTATVAKDMEGTTATSVPIGTECIHGPTVRDWISGTAVYAQRSSSDIVLNGTTWYDLDTGLDLTLPAFPGDHVGVEFIGYMINENVNGYLDAVSVVSGTPAYSWALDAAPDDSKGGVSSWAGGATLYANLSGRVVRRVTTSDLSGTMLTIRFRARTSSASNKTLRSSDGSILRRVQVNAINLGPQYDVPTY